KVTGEHWCSVCEEDLSKHKGTYVKLYWRGTEDDGAEKISVVCPDCLKKDKILDKGLKLLEDVAKPVEVSRGRVCSFCGNPVKKSERSLRVEFRYDGSELRADVCEKCIDEREEIKAIHVKAPNPVFNVKVNCLSADVCESFKKPGKDRGINCGHIVANMDGELYCRRGHPGHVRVYRERYAIPPSRKRLTKMITELFPIYDKIKNGAKLLGEESSSQAVSAVPREIPDTLEYVIKEYPVEGDTVSLPWNAHVIEIGKQTVTAMVLVEKKEEEK
ncbi:unnamed protein product, partial [marine sediment metagenome]